MKLKTPVACIKLVLFLISAIATHSFMINITGQLYGHKHGCQVTLQHDVGNTNHETHKKNSFQYRYSDGTEIHYYPMTSVEISGERWCWELRDFPTPSVPVRFPNTQCPSL